MNSRSLALQVGVLLCVALRAQAQVPVAPAAPASGGCLAGLCTALCACKVSCCSSPFGQLIGGMIKPVSIMTGGVIPVPCAGPGMLAAAAGQAGPAGTAAAIQQSEANAKARRAAVRYLGTVDCHYFPEAEATLIAALRADTNECVRWEAAHAFANGCCCSKKTVAALTLTVQASDRDGNPCEDSLRVRTEAFNALQRCLASGGIEPVRPEIPGVEAPLAATPEPNPMTIALIEAQRTVDATEQELRPTQQAKRDRSLLGAWTRARDPVSTSPGRSALANVKTPEPHIATGPRLNAPEQLPSRPLATPSNTSELTPLPPVQNGIEVDPTTGGLLRR